MDTVSIEVLTGEDIRRDQWGRYLIAPPGGGAPVGYTRVTTVAKELDKGGGLAPWKSTMTATGLIMRRGLRAAWEQLLAEHNGDPWYHTEASKKACKQLVEECAAVGGANDRAKMGEALHAITAMVDLGRTPIHLTAETEADITAYVDGLAAAGVIVCPGQVELVVVLDDWEVAGTFDRLVTIPGFDLPLIADLKTGADLSYGWQAMAVQLAGYSRADAIYEQGVAADGSQDQRLPMPAVDQHSGLIMWLNAGTANLELYVVNLDAGWEAFEQSMWARQWRKRAVSMPLADYAVEVATSNSLVEQLEQSIAQATAEKAARKGQIDVYQPELGESDGEITPEPEDYRRVLRAWLQERINAVGAHSKEAKTDLGSNWPKDIPTLRSSDDHDFEQLHVIEQLLDAVEGRHEVPFGEPRPANPDPVATVLHLFPGSETINDNSKEPA